MTEPRLGRCGHPLTGQQRTWCSKECSAAAARSARLLAHFAITEEEFAAILEEQGGGCAICGRRPKPGKAFAVDHDHRTTFVRGLCCYVCNLRLLGSKSDDIIFALAEYVRNPPARRVIGDRPAPGRPPKRRTKRPTNTRRKVSRGRS